MRYVSVDSIVVVVVVANTATACKLTALSKCQNSHGRGRGDRCKRRLTTLEG